MKWILNLKKTAIRAIFTICLLILFSSMPIAEMRFETYLDDTAGIKNILELDYVFHFNGYRFSLKNENYELLLESSAGITKKFSLKKLEKKLYVTGYQIGSKAFITLKNGSESMSEKSFELGSSPWIQNFILLKPFLKNFPASFEYWVFSDSESNFRKLVLRKSKSEVLNMDSNVYTAIKYTLNAKGIPGIFWTAHIWFDQESGEFLYYKGLSGLPGSPQKTFRAYLKKP